MIPEKKLVTFVALKEADGTFYLAIKDAETKPDLNLELEFKPVTINELKKELQKLNPMF